MTLTQRRVIDAAKALIENLPDGEYQGLGELRMAIAAAETTSERDAVLEEVTRFLAVFYQDVRLTNNEMLDEMIAGVRAKKSKPEVGE